MTESEERTQFEECFGALAAIGRNEVSGGWTRFAWTPEDAEARLWFIRTARAAGAKVEADRDGNLWALAGPVGEDDRLVATGSHLDTVRNGGAFDGALGVVAGLLALRRILRSGAELRRGLAVVAFVDEEGGRFGTPTLGSELLCGERDPADVLERTDQHGVTMREAMAAAGVNIDRLGRDEARLARLDAFVELHVEQGRGLADLGSPLAVGAGAWPHGRWRFEAVGEANHAGTTRLADRRDPMLVLADAVTEARRLASGLQAVATIGRVEVAPNVTNAIPQRVTFWVDVRAPDEATLERLVAELGRAARLSAARNSVQVEIACESRTSGTSFDGPLQRRLGDAVEAVGATACRLPTAAGHDAAVLARHLPAGMLFVRNPTGTSHSPAEHASVEDCLVGVRALTTVLQDLTSAASGEP
jgi:N-carbamoyl-L-amino-acid hydrolase